jgi:hypothetical protein
MVVAINKGQAFKLGKFIDKKFEQEEILSMLVCLLYTYTDEPKQFIKEYLKAIR